VRPVQAGNPRGKTRLAENHLNGTVVMAALRPFTIMYEDNSIIAVNKASGIAVTGERWDGEAPRLDLLLKRELTARQESAEEAELFTVHRIDKDTAGLVVFARERETHKAMSSAFESRQVKKTYIAVIHGRPLWPEGKTTCDLPLVPDGSKKHLTIIDKYRGKHSLTAFTLLFSTGNYSVVEACPATGRTHQIRVHLSGMGYPIVCDPLYGRSGGRLSYKHGIYLSSFKRGWQGDAFEERPLLERLGLHAARLELSRSLFPAPGAADASGTVDTSGVFALEAPLSRDMAALIKQMEKCGLRQTLAMNRYL